MPTLVEKVQTLKVTAYVAGKTAQFWEQKIAEHGEAKATEFYKALGLNHIEDKCGANAPGGGGFQLGNTCATGGGAGEGADSGSTAVGEATTTAEAESHASKFCSGKVSFRGVSVEHANEVNKELNDLFESHDFEKLTEIKAMPFKGTKGLHPDAIAAYRGGLYSKTLYLNTAIMGNAKKLDVFNKEYAKAREFVRERIDKPEFAHLREKGLAMLKGEHVDDSLRGYIRHEVGHHADNHYTSGRRGQSQEEGRAGYNRRLDAVKDWKSYAPKVSYYATTSVGEYMAESFVAWRAGKDVDPNVATLFRDLRRKK